MVEQARGIRRVVIAALAATGLVLAAPAAAPAATVIGSTGTPNDALYVGDEKTYVQDVGPGQGGNLYTAPTAGVITSWGSQANAVANRTQKLLITRNPDADTTWQVVARDQLRTLVTPNALNTFLVRIPVLAGDQLAFFVPDGQNGGDDSSAIFNSGGGSIMRDVAGVEPVAAFTVDMSSATGTRLNVTATIEADADGDGFGDESQDQCPTNASVQTVCPPAPLAATPSKKCKKRKGKKGVAAKRCKKRKK